MKDLSVNRIDFLKHCDSQLNNSGRWITNNRFTENQAAESRFSFNYAKLKKEYFK